MNEYRFVENESGMGVMQKKVRQAGQPDAWVDDLKVPVYRHEYAKKKWVEDMIRIADPDFKGTYTTMADIEAITPVNSNDWAYLKEVDENGNDVYSRYRYTDTEGWIFEVAIKRDNFTDEEWAAITSGINSQLVEKLENLSDTTQRPFKSSWHTDTTLLQFCQDVAGDQDVVVGDFFLGGLSCSGLPEGMQNGEVQVQILQGASNMKLLLLVLTSTNLSPYHWEQSYFNGTLYGWKSFDPEGTAQQIVADTIETMAMSEETGDITVQYDDGEEENDNDE